MRNSYALATAAITTVVANHALRECLSCLMHTRPRHTDKQVRMRETAFLDGRTQEVTDTWLMRDAQKSVWYTRFV
jgi:hypothetical protein